MPIISKETYLTHWKYSPPEEEKPRYWTFCFESDLEPFCMSIPTTIIREDAKEDDVIKFLNSLLFARKNN